MLNIALMSADMSTDEKNKFESFYNKYKSLLYRQALGLVGNESDAEDILQNAFIKIARNIKAIGSTDSKETLSFLIVITKNTAYDFMRKESKILLLPLSEAEKAESYDDEIDKLVGKIQYRKTVEIITEIPSPYNEVLYLHYVKDYSVKKTARLLERKPSTVKMQLVRGKKILAERLKEVIS